MKPSVEVDRAGALLRTAVDIADGSSNLAERRLAIMMSIAQLTDADSGHWAWVRGRPESEKLLLVGFIPFNYSEEQLAAFSQFALDPRLQQDFHARLYDYMQRHTRDDGVWSVITRDAVPEVANEPDHWITQSMLKIGVADWMQAGRFVPGNAFSSLTIGRRPGKPPFDDADRQLIDLAMTNIPWLWANPDESVPQSEVEALSPRQRAVAFLVLDGLGRKHIASRLGISEETVNHHIKCIFRHFGVQSATELAALFLRNQ